MTASASARDAETWAALLDDPERFWDPAEYLPYLKVKPKRGPLIPFDLWSHQQLLAAFTVAAYEYEKWLVHVKPRQEGSSTFFAGVAAQHATCRPGTRVGVMAHKRAVAKELVKIAIRFYNTTPAFDLRPTKSAGPKTFLRLKFADRPDEDSEIVYASARDEEPFRGETIHFLLATEVSSWSETGGPDAWAAALSAVPRDGFVIAESTPKHHGDELHGLWTDAHEPGSKWMPVFIPWTKVEEYAATPPVGWLASPEVADYAHKNMLTDEQAFWMQTVGLDKTRRDMSKFRAEYPVSEDDCWLQAGDAVYNVDMLQEMRRRVDGNTGLMSKYGEKEVFVPPVLGHRYLIFVDPASELTKRDFFGVQVIDIDSCEQVAEFHGHHETYNIARVIREWHETYFRARVYVEANGVGESLITTLRGMGLRTPEVLYHRRAAAGDGRLTPGWWSSDRYKHEAVSALQELINDGSLTLHSVRLIRQLIAYRGHRNQRDGEGGHFDLASAMAGAAWAWRNEAKRRRPVYAPTKSPEQIQAETMSRFIIGLDRPTRGNSRWGTHT